jgi:hypothetical protein
MTERPRKPPIDKKSVSARLEHAQEHQLLVRVRRWIPDADPLDGFVVGIGRKWVVLQRVMLRCDFDGWQLFRLKDVQSMSMDPDPGCFEVRALKARTLWPPSAPELSLDDAVAVLETVSSASMMVSVYDEYDKTDACWIGAVTSVDESKLRLLEVDTLGEWKRKPRTIDPADVTRLEFGGRYEEALSLAAGPLPDEWARN